MAKTRPRIPRVGAHVRFNPNPASLRLYSKPPPRGATGHVIEMYLFGRFRRYMPGPGGGLLYVEWEGGEVQGVALQDVEVID
jgi:hypothetical protein